jgi:hypothetical protein
MAEERRENIMSVELAIQREQAYRRKVSMLQLNLNNDMNDLMPLEVRIQIEDSLTIYKWLDYFPFPQQMFFLLFLLPFFFLMNQPLFF